MHITNNNLAGKSYHVFPIFQCWDLHVPKGAVCFLEELVNHTVDASYVRLTSQREATSWTVVFFVKHIFYFLPNGG